MKNSQDAMDRVLTGLRDVSAPEGMEQRLRAAMESRAAAKAGWQWRSWSIGLAAAVVLVAAVVVSLRPHKVPTQAVEAVERPLALPTFAAALPTQKRNTEILRVAQNDLGRGVHGDIAPPSVQAMDTGGIPAPPMPLTEQERLLLRLAHRTDATELTPLNAEARARQNAEFDAEFQEFFAPPVVAEIDTNSTEPEKGETR